MQIKQFLLYADAVSAKRNRSIRVHMNGKTIWNGECMVGVVRTFWVNSNEEGHE